MATKHEKALRKVWSNFVVRAEKHALRKDKSTPLLSRMDDAFKAFVNQIDKIYNMPDLTKLRESFDHLLNVNLDEWNIDTCNATLDVLRAVKEVLKND